MKKLLVIAVATLALAACTQERNIVPAEPGVTEITATHVSTRSALYASDGETLYNILWDVSDQIMVGYAGTELATFTSKNESPAAEATFTGKLPEGSGELYGIYPAEDGNTVEADGTYKIMMHTVQTAVEGSYDPMAFPAIAQSESKNLSFMNVFGLLELTVGYEDVTSIFFGVKMSGNEVDPRPLTRKTANPLVMSVQMKDGEPLITSIDGDNETGGYVLNPPKGSEYFTMDTPYYLAVHPVGGWLQGISPAFWLTHSDGSTTEIVFDSNPIIERSKVHPVKRLFLEEVTPDEPEDPYNGHEYVDLGLPSGLKWATCNVGAENPEDYGDYFAWAETEPYYESIAENGTVTWRKGKEAGYTWDSYSWVKHSFEDWEYNPDNPSLCITKYTIDDKQYYSLWYLTSMGDGGTEHQFSGDGVSTLGDPAYDYEDDAARKNWGGSWRTPTPSDFQELLDNCTWTWTTQNGVYGRLVTAANGNSIFLPAAGYRYGTSLLNDGSLGYYWSSSLSGDYSDYARTLYFNSGDLYAYDRDRNYGRSVRPVSE